MKDIRVGKINATRTQILLLVDLRLDGLILILLEWPKMLIVSSWSTSHVANN